MTTWTAAGPTLLAAFKASTVEFVEARTIVLAVGVPVVLALAWRATRHPDAPTPGEAGPALTTALLALLAGSALRRAAP